MFYSHHEFATRRNIMDRKKARKKATELVSQMTLEEKASQLRYDAPAIKRLGIPAYNWWNEALHGVARAGQATIFPQDRYLQKYNDESNGFFFPNTIDWARKIYPADMFDDLIEIYRFRIRNHEGLL